MNPDRLPAAAPAALSRITVRKLCASMAARGEHCHAGRDGDCEWLLCPQDFVYQSYCPLAAIDERVYGERR